VVCLVKKLYLSALICLTHASIGYADNASILCPRAIEAAESRYLDTLQKKLIESSEKDRHGIAQMEFMKYQEQLEQLTAKQLKQIHAQGGDVNKVRSSLKTLDKLNSLHYEFFACTLLQEPRQQKKELLKIGFNYCEKLINGAKPMRCLTP